MKKITFIINIIKTIFIFMLLMFVFTKNEQLYLRIMILSFLFLSICYIAENVCHLFDKPIGVKFFHKLFIIIFLIFSSYFLIVWSYAWIREKQYFPILFTIPIWIFEIYIFYRSLLGLKPNSKLTNKKIKIDFKIVVSCILVICVLLSGLICLIIGIKDTYNTNRITKNYSITTCYFKDYEIYDSHKSEDYDRTQVHTTYRLIYVYEVDGQEYSIKTDYGSGSIPSINSKRKIKYNPNNPSEAVFIGTNRNIGLIYYGAFFLLGGIAFVLIFLYAKGVFDKVKINILGLYIGFIFLVIGIGIITFQIGEVSSLIEVIKRMKYWLFIPIMFIIIGFFQIIKCLFFERL